MKRIRVDNLQPPADPESPITARQMYEVVLGNHVVVRFASKRQALAYQAEATRELTGLLMSCNLMLLEAFTQYRMAWPYFTDGDGLGHLVREAEDQMDRAARVNGPNAVFFRWRGMDAALVAIRSMALLLAKVWADKSHGVARHQAQQLAERCTELRQQLQHYGTDVDTSKGHRPSPYSGA